MKASDIVTGCIYLARAESGAATLDVVVIERRADGMYRVHPVGKPRNVLVRSHRGLQPRAAKLTPAGEGFAAMRAEHEHAVAEQAERDAMRGYDASDLQQLAVFGVSLAVREAARSLLIERGVALVAPDGDRGALSADDFAEMRSEYERAVVREMDLMTQASSKTLARLAARGDTRIVRAAARRMLAAEVVK